MMGHSFFCVLEFFFFILVLNTPFYYGHAEDAVLTLEPSWSTFFTGESVTFICDINEGKDTDWFYKINKGGREFGSNKDWTISSLSTGYSDVYQCIGTHKSSLITKSSNNISLNVSAYKPKATLTPGATTIPRGGRVTLSCSVDVFGDWKYDWFGQTSYNIEAPITTVGEENRVITVSEGGVYRCRGRRGQPVFYTDVSSYVPIVKTISNYVTVTPNWPQMFSGETITLRCEIQGGGHTGWQYCWRTPWSTTEWTNTNSWTFSVSVHSSGNYMCKGRNTWDPYALTEWSKPITVAEAAKPKAHLRADSSDIPVGGSVTLTCSVKTSSGWKYFWYRGDKSSDPLTTQDAVSYSSGRISVSQEGLYWCRGGRGNPVYYTENSDSVRINKNVPNKATVTLQHTWSQIFTDETITLTCEITDRGDTEWEYEWRTPRSMKPPEQKEYEIRRVTSSHRGEYSCRARMKTAQQSSTDWSDVFILTVSDKPKPVLTVSPSWLSPGASVTLNCEVEHPSAGWRFYWYKTVPDLSGKYYKYYRYELLPGRDNGTEQNSSIIHGQTHTAGYVCRAGRGDPVYYTDHSEPKFVWSGDVHPSASLTVNPDRVQHFYTTLTVFQIQILSCVFFYQNDKLRQNDTRQELNISAVSKSDEGFYKCQYSGKESPQSWVTVKVAEHTSSSLPVALIIGLVCGITFLILLLLLFGYRQSKDSCFIRNLKA